MPQKLSLLFTRKHDVNIPPLYMNDDVLEDVLKHKHLATISLINGALWNSSINGIPSIVSIHADSLPTVRKITTKPRQ
jgi:hypothetical protein